MAQMSICGERASADSEFSEDLLNYSTHHIQCESLTCSYDSIVDSRGPKNHFFLLSFLRIQPVEKMQAVEKNFNFRLYIISQRIASN